MFEKINTTHSKLQFTKSDTQFFKGIGILIIVLHNYFHFLPGFQIENEFFFDSQNHILFFEKLTKGSVGEFISGIFSFLGHYGVQLFFFFSAYGLTKQYPNWTNHTLSFVTTRLKKIYFLMFFGVVVSIAIMELVGISFGIKGILLRTFILATTLNSFTTISMIIGPFWFFAAIIQFYILFPILYKFVSCFRVKTYFFPIIIALILVYILFFSFDGFPMKLGNESFQLSVFRNVVGHLPELLLGISLAHFHINSFSKSIIFLALLVLIGSQIYWFLFPLSFISVTILMVWSLQKFKLILHRQLQNILIYVGNVSMILFVVNGAFRSLIQPSLHLGRTVFYLVSLFVVSHLLLLIYNFLSKKFKI